MIIKEIINGLDSLPIEEHQEFVQTKAMSQITVTDDEEDQINNRIQQIEDVFSSCYEGAEKQYFAGSAYGDEIERITEEYLECLESKSERHQCRKQFVLCSIAALNADYQMVEDTHNDLIDFCAGVISKDINFYDPEVIDNTIKEMVKENEHKQSYNDLPRGMKERLFPKDLYPQYYL